MHASLWLAGVAAALPVALLGVALINHELDCRRLERRVKLQLQAAIPVGAPVSQAYTVLDQIRPHVQRRTSAPFEDRKQLDYLYLMWHEAAHRMEAAVVHKDGRVTEILVEGDSANDPR